MTDEIPIERLLDIMAQLRDPQKGCPWDRKQTFDSVVPHTLEEAYEVADCIERGDLAHLKEELGDLLFQVIFYSQLAEEENRFSFGDVVTGLNEKLVRRHPHVFPSEAEAFPGFSSSTTEEGQVSEQVVRTRWEEIKQWEKQSTSSCDHLSQMDDVPRHLPALSRAQKLQKRAANVGFDWSNVFPALAKIAEETDELKQALENDDHENALEEIGDLMFSCVNVARHLKGDSEQLLRQANDKFEARFRRIERMLVAQNISWEESDLAQLDRFWTLAKQEE